jgi:hypothetical protein
MSNHHLDRYHKFIDSLRNQVVRGYCEKHHILPRSLGGSDDASNLILLTLRQHYLAHWMLWKAYGGAMAVAFDYMNGIKRYGKRLPSRVVAALKADVSKRISERPVSEETRKKQSQAKLGKKLSAEHVEKVRLAVLGRKMGPEFSAKVSEAKRGRGNGRNGCSMSAETKQRIGDAQRGALNHMAGRKHSPETKERMRIAHMKRNKPEAYLAWLAEGNTPLPPDEQTGQNTPIQE